MLKESEITKISEKLRSFGSLIDEVSYGRKDVKDIDSIAETVEKWLDDNQLNAFDRFVL